MTSKYESFSLSYKDFKERLLAVLDPQDQAYFATQYAGYARVGEIVRGKYKHNPALTVDDFEITESAADGKHLRITILTEKTGQYRCVPVSWEKEEWLVQIITDWISVCGNELFPFTTRWAQSRFKKSFGTGRTHLLRHWATNHALQGHRTKERLQPDEIARFGGWTNLNTFYKTYTHFVVEDVLHKV